MKDDRDIDALLRQHAEQQLSGFDWEGLCSGITKRVAAGVRPPSRTNYWGWVAVAATVVVIVGVVVFAMLGISKPDVDRTAIGEAKVIVLGTTGAAGRAEVAFGATEELGRCEIRLIESDEAREVDQERPSWWIVAGCRPSVAEADTADIACLF